MPGDGARSRGRVGDQAELSGESLSARREREHGRVLGAARCDGGVGELRQRHGTATGAERGDAVAGRAVLCALDTHLSEGAAAAVHTGRGQRERPVRDQRDQGGALGDRHGRDRLQGRHCRGVVRLRAAGDLAEARLVDVGAGERVEGDVAALDRGIADVEPAHLVVADVERAQGVVAHVGAGDAVVLDLAAVDEAGGHAVGDAAQRHEQGDAGNHQCGRRAPPQDVLHGGGSSESGALRAPNTVVVRSERTGAGAPTGSVTTNRAPPPWASSSSTRPPWASATALTIASPSPLPPARVVSPLPRANRSKTRSRSAAGTPGPRSATSSTALSASRRTETVTGVPAAVWIRAFSTRFPASRCRSSATPVTVTGAGRSSATG